MRPYWHIQMAGPLSVSNVGHMGPLWRVGGGGFSAFCLRCNPGSVGQKIVWSLECPKDHFCWQSPRRRCSARAGPRPLLARVPARLGVPAHGRALASCLDPHDRSARGAAAAAAAARQDAPHRVPHARTRPRPRISCGARPSAPGKPPRGRRAARAAPRATARASPRSSSASRASSASAS